MKKQARKKESKKCWREGKRKISVNNRRKERNGE
jgi:hypothetical protein